mmetsp:Transcript_14847/g.28760  ORF Transcript_14847/g.28760 Transcript_14847/m.28760 type:complete len:329 (+) Transcript_14847:222-1208(+)
MSSLEDIVQSSCETLSRVVGDGSDIEISTFESLLSLVASLGGIPLIKSALSKNKAMILARRPAPRGLSFHHGNLALNDAYLETCALLLETADESDTFGLRVNCRLLASPLVSGAFINRGANVNATFDDDKWGYTCIADALLYHDIHHVKYLVKRGFNPNSSIYFEGSPSLFIESFNIDDEDDDMEVDTDLLEYLLELPNINLKAVDAYLKSPAHLAIHLKPDIMKRLVELGADLNGFDSAEMTPLMWLCDLNHNLEMVKILVQGGADINACNSIGRSALYYSTQRNDLATVKYLVSHGATDILNALCAMSVNSDKARDVYNYLACLIQ